MSRKNVTLIVAALAALSTLASSTSSASCGSPMTGLDTYRAVIGSRYLATEMPFELIVTVHNPDPTMFLAVDIQSTNQRVLGLGDACGGLDHTTLNPPCTVGPLLAPGDTRVYTVKLAFPVQGSDVVTIQAAPLTGAPYVVPVVSGDLVSGVMTKDGWVDRYYDHFYFERDAAASRKFACGSPGCISPGEARGEAGA